MANKLRQGDPLSAISAGEWNRHCDVADWYERRVRLGHARPAMPAQVSEAGCIVYNNSGANRSQGDVLEIAGAECATTEQATIVLTGALRSSSGPLCVLLEPIPSGGYGRATLGGVVVASVDVGDADHSHCYADSSSALLKSNFGGPARIIYKPSGTGTKTCVVHLGGALYRRKGKTTASVSAGSSGACDVYLNGSAVGSVTAWLNWMENGISAIGSGVEVEVEWFDDERKWVIVAAECE